MLHKHVFILAHKLANLKFYSNYKKIVANQWKSYPELERDQEKQLRRIIDFSYNYVPYYRKLFKDQRLHPNDIKTIKDLEKLPILTRDTIRHKSEEFIPENLLHMKYYTNKTGGSTGTPLKYRLSKEDRFLGGAILYRGWGFAGYSLGDSILFLGATSLDIDEKDIIDSTLHRVFRNIRKISTFDMEKNQMEKYVDALNTFKPKFFRSYTTPIYFFAKWIEQNNMKIHQPQAIFTTAETLYPVMREKIEDVFQCDVFDHYGLNDGGISAYECPEHRGLHIDTERSIMEVVTPSGEQITEGNGSMLATSLNNYAMPFIRYDTGDLGEIIDETCPCGRGSKLLKRIIGRSIHIFFTPDGKNVYGGFFDILIQENGEGIKEYQVLQTKLDEILIKIVPEENCEKQIEMNIRIIKELIKKRGADWHVDYEIVDSIERTQSGKYRSIINTLIE